MRFFISLFTISCFAVCLTLSGCGGGGGGGGGASSRASVVFSGESTLTRSAEVSFTDLRGTTLPSDVDEDDIESLTLTITEIEFKYAGTVEDDDDDSDDERTVEVSATAFDPTSITIEVGHTVRWVWTENGMHTITSGAVGDGDAGSLFDMSEDTTGDVVELLFTEVGVFPYFSNTEADIENGMSGVVTVVEDDEMESRGEEEEEDDDDNTTFITVFAGSIDVNILDLTLFDLNEIITNVVLPAGQYKGARLHIENPRLVLKADPGTVITDVQLTANGRLFIKHDFFLPGGEEAVVKIQFGDIHLVITGSGKYVLTPHLKIVTDDGPVEAEFKGEITEIAEDKMSITVQHKFSFSSWIVIIDEFTEIFEVVDDMENPLTVDNLAVGQCVEIEGVLNEDNTITADEIEVEDGAVKEE